jgi:hypothetical protein
MEQDLDIENYNLSDILNLFKLPVDFNDEQLKNAKKIVLFTHPDKSGLSPDYFRFYSKAYKKLFLIWEFKNKNSSKINNSVYSVDKNNHNSQFEFSNSEKNILDNNKIKQSDNFNKWFNEQFEKYNVKTEEHGYGNWLISNEDIEENKQIPQNLIGSEIEKKKQQLKSLIVHKDINDIYVNNISSSNLIDDIPESYGSGLFSKLHYEDLYKAHTETVVPVTIEDYNNVKKFKSQDEYIKYRSSQNTTPLSELQAKEYLSKKNKIQDEESTFCAYKLAKQSEEVEKKQQIFWGDLMKITNY